LFFLIAFGEFLSFVIAEWVLEVLSLIGVANHEVISTRESFEIQIADVGCLVSIIFAILIYS
jgi:hypothetical protein